jgi:purine-nucleoside phosphorylase
MIPAEAEQAAAFLRDNGFDGSFACAIVLGTGLGEIADDVEAAVRMPYARIPHFPHGRVSGHAGRLTTGRLADRRILVLQGRAHYYETGDAAAMRVPIAALRALGGPPLLLTNAAGSTRPGLPPGGHVLITDHINFCGANPLVGEATDARFVSMTGAYDEALRRQMKRAADAAEVALGEGVYMWFSGPSFETPAEIRMAQALGADLVGMSTVPEVILARYYGLKVVAVSVVTNMAAGIGGASPSHAETKAQAAEAAAGLRRLVRAFVSRLEDV